MPVGNETNHRFDGLTVEGGLAVKGSGSATAYLSASSNSGLLTNGSSISQLLAPGGADELSQTLISNMTAFRSAVVNHATDSYSVRGVDLVDNLVFCADVTNGLLRQSPDWGATWSSGKGNPTNVVGATGIGKMVRFGGNLYALSLDSVASLAKISRTAPVAGNGAFSWTDVFTAPTGSNAVVRTELSAGSQYLFYGTYGTPTAGATIYRSSDGTTWTAVYGPDLAIPNHIHCVKEDPYNAGHIYATTGDGGGKTIMRSTQHGAVGTWSTIVAASEWQAVQISFDSKWVWFGHDSQRMTAMVLNRTNLVPYVASPNYHWYLAVPGAAVVTNRYRRNAYYGAVDPATGIYYCVPNDTSVAGNTSALLFIARPGAEVRILDDAAGFNGEVFFGGGYVFSGGYHKEQLTVAEVQAS